MLYISIVFILSIMIVFLSSRYGNKIYDIFRNFINSFKD